jgi:hypothetical protein
MQHHIENAHEDNLPLNFVACISAFVKNDKKTRWQREPWLDCIYILYPVVYHVTKAYLGDVNTTVDY